MNNKPKWTPGPFHCPTCATERGVSVPKFGTCPHHPSYTTIRAAAPDLYEALDRLAGEVAACFGMGNERSAREAFGNTNYSAVMERIAAAKAALAKAQGD